MYKKNIYQGNRWLSLPLEQYKHSKEATRNFS